MDPIVSRLTDNVARVRERIARAALRCGRQPDAVQLVAVTKYVDTPVVQALAAAGCRDLGENRPQELWRKAEATRGLDVGWHLVGHLQRNKVVRTLPYLVLLHSVDSERLLEAVSQAAERSGRRLAILLEVNISRESAKHGFAPDEVAGVVDRIGAHGGVELRGLMAMASLSGGLAQARRDFADLRRLRDTLRAGCPDQASLDELSMGMSHDFEVAIEEGATIVRIGTALYEGLQEWTV